jgi:hypothetical protein
MRKENSSSSANLDSEFPGCHHALEYLYQWLSRVVEAQKIWTVDPSIRSTSNEQASFFSVNRCHLNLQIFRASVLAFFHIHFLLIVIFMFFHSLHLHFFHLLWFFPLEQSQFYLFFIFSMFLITSVFLSPLLSLTLPYCFYFAHLIHCT